MALTINDADTARLLRILSQISQAQSTAYTRLSSGSRINSASDDPAGLIALESLDAELTALDAAIDNNQRTDAMLSVADGAMQQISSLLTEIESLAISSASDSTLTASELAAYQAEIDAAIASIDRIVSTTSFNGKKLLDGSQAIQATGVDSTKIEDLRIFTRSSYSTSTSIVVELQTAATKATCLLYTSPSPRDLSTSRMPSSA